MVDGINKGYEVYDNRVKIHNLDLEEAEKLCFAWEEPIYVTAAITSTLAILPITLGGVFVLVENSTAGWIVLQIGGAGCAAALTGVGYNIHRRVYHNYGDRFFAEKVLADLANDDLKDVARRYNLDALRFGDYISAKAHKAISIMLSKRSTPEQRRDLQFRYFVELPPTYQAR